MKKLITILMLVTIGLASCTKENIQPQIFYTTNVTDTVYVPVTDTVYVPIENENQIQYYHIRVQGLSTTTGNIIVNGDYGNQFSFERFVQSGDLVVIENQTYTGVQIIINNNLVYDQWSTPGIIFNQVME